MEISPENVMETRKHYAKLQTPFDVFDNVVGFYAWLWDECYGKERITEGEFAKLAKVDFTIARQRCEELHGRSMSDEHFEQTALSWLLIEYGECEMADDFRLRPWRFAA